MKFWSDIWSKPGDQAKDTCYPSVPKREGVPIVAVRKIKKIMIIMGEGK